MASEPQLEFAFEVRAQVATPIDLGVTRQGHRRVIPILGGVVEGSRIAGTVLEGGADWQILHADGAADLDARYTIRTNDDALIYVNNRGIRRGSPEVLKRLNAGETVDASEIYFRSVATFETSAPDYAWMSDALFIGAGQRYPDRVLVRFYRVG